MASRVRKTFVIGLGGTGIEAVLSLKREFIDHFGCVPPVVRMLGIDTAHPRVSDAPNAGGEPVSLNGNEFLYVSVLDPVAVLAEHQEIRGEFPESQTELRAILSGSGQVRACGRLAILANALAIATGIEDAYKSVSSAEAKDRVIDDRRLGLSSDPFVTVYIISSLAGGTGSGAFLDVAYMCREILGRNDRILGIFMLPSMFTAFPATDYVEGNSYAALKELDFLMERANSHLPAPDVVNYGSGFRVDWARNLPFDQVYLVDNCNERGVQFQNPSRISGIVGSALFANAIAVAEQSDDVLDNIAGSLSREDTWEGKRPYYAGLGASAIEVPISKIVSLASLRKAKSLLVDEFLGSEVAEVDSIEFWREICAETIDRGDSSFAVSMTLKEPWVLPDLEEAIAQWKHHELSEAEVAFRDDAAAQFSQALDRTKSRLIERVERAILKDSGGLDCAASLLLAIDINIRAEQELTSDILMSLASNRIELQREYPSISEVQTATRGFLTRHRVEKLIGLVEQGLHKEAICLREIAWRESAGEFLRGTAAIAHDISNQVEDLRSKLKQAALWLSDQIERTLNSREPLGFISYLDEDCMEEEVEKIGSGISKSLFRSSLEESGESLLAWVDAEHDTEAIAKRIYTFAADRFSLLEDMSLDSILSRINETSPDRLAKYIREFLIDRATPLWRPSQVFSRANLTRILILGVPDEETSFLREANLSTFGVNPRRCRLASTGNKHRISAFQYKLRVPAYVVGGIDELKAEYERREPLATFTHHIRRDWADNPAMLGDLFPPRKSGTPAQMMYWSISFAAPFHLITSRGSGYYFIRSERLGNESDDYWMRLGRGRRSAYEAFVSGEHSGDFLEEIKDTISAKILALGTLAITQELVGYSNSMEEQSGRAISQDLGSLLRDEREAIKRFLDLLSTHGLSLKGDA